MNPITAFLMLVCVVAGVAVGHWAHLYLALVFFAAALIIGLSLKTTNAWQTIGSSMLAALLSDRKVAHQQLKREIGQKTAAWGISISWVKVRAVAIPVALQDAMSRQAQAKREKQARVILGSVAAAIAGKFVEAADSYDGHPVTLQLRA